MDDLDNPGELLPVKRLNSLTQIFFLLKGKHRNLGLLYRNPFFWKCFITFFIALEVAAGVKTEVDIINDSSF